MAETDAPMFQSTRSMKREMDEILSEKQDPVSGNTAPIGATPAEVRDDIPIMASPNEFMIDAATRRYYGTPFFENLQAAAKQGFKRIKAGEESFFRDDELEVEQEAQKMNEGGEVDTIEDREIPAPMGGGYFGAGGTGSLFTGFEFKIYIDPTTGREIQIIFFNGRPLSPIPDGFVLKADTPVEAQEQKRQSDGGGGGDKPDPKPTFRNTPVNKWTNDMFKNYSSSLQSDPNAGLLNAAEKGFVYFVGNLLLPGVGGIALEKLAVRENKKIAENVVATAAKYLQSGKDNQGNTLSQSDLDMYNTARINANFALSRISGSGFFKPATSFEADSQEAKNIIAQQQAYIQTLRDRDPSDDPTPSTRISRGPDTFYGGTAETETDLILSDLTDEEFFKEFEVGAPGGISTAYAAGTPSGAGTPSTLPPSATATSPDVEDINEQFSGPQ